MYEHNIYACAVEEGELLKEIYFVFCELCFVSVRFTKRQENNRNIPCLLCIYVCSAAKCEMCKGNSNDGPVNRTAYMDAIRH